MSTPEETTRLTTLTEAQARLLDARIAEAERYKQAAQKAAAAVEELLQFAAPPGANGFDYNTYTFLSVPQGEPEGTPKETEDA